MSHPYMESIIISILKYANDIANVLGLKGYSTIKALSIYQYCIAEICDILPWTILEFETLHVLQSPHQIITRIGKNSNHGGDIDLGPG